MCDNLGVYFCALSFSFSGFSRLVTLKVDYIFCAILHVVQALIIAFTSKFVDRLVYKSLYSNTHSLEGFVNNSLAYFNVSDFPKGTAPHPEEITPQYNGTTVCR